MFGRLKAKAVAAFLTSDTEKTLRNVLPLPADAQRSCAQKVLDEIFAALIDLENTTGSSHDRDEVFKKHLERAQERRHQAIAMGARDHSDPNWAAAALIEGWLTANTGELGRETFNKIDGLTMGWIRSTLTVAEIEATERRAKNPK